MEASSERVPHGSSPSSRQGDVTAWCYGYRWGGLEVGEPWLVTEAGRAADILVDQQVLVDQRIGEDLAGPELDARGNRAAFPLVSGGFLLVDREAGTATYHVPSVIDPRELVHPYLVPAAAAFCEWSGREAYHAGAVVLGGSAWAVVGDRQAGKSSTLAVLATRGYPVLSDDLLVLDGREVLAGPRLIDLREPSAARLGIGQPLASARVGGRWRMALGAAPEAELAGWVYLSWGPKVAVRAIPAAERVHRLIALRPTRPGAVLALAALPAYELVRPLDWDQLSRSLDVLLTVLA